MANVARFHPLRGGSSRRSSDRPELFRLRHRLPAEFRVPTEDHRGRRRAGRPTLWLNAFVPGHPTLAVAGLVQPDSGIFPLSNWQMVLFAPPVRLRHPLRTGPAAFAAKVRRTPVSATRARSRESTRHWFEVGHRRLPCAPSSGPCTAWRSPGECESAAQRRPRVANECRHCECEECSAAEPRSRERKAALWCEDVQRSGAPQSRTKGRHVSARSAAQRSPRVANERPAL